MAKEDDYRWNAAQTVDLANRAVKLADKRHLLSLAEKWLDLADRTHAFSRRDVHKGRDHPLVKAKLDRTPSPD
jgi:hypothetical protein